MPAMPHIPTAAISPERLKELQASYSRDAMELMQQANAQSIDVSTLKDRRFNTTAWQSTPAFAFTPQPPPRGRPAPASPAMAAIDPCRGTIGNGHIRCVQRHFKLAPPHRAGSSGGIGGSGK